MKKKIKCWIEVYGAKDKDHWWPTIFYKKPSAGEISLAHEFNCEIYPAEISYET